MGLPSVAILSHKPVLELRSPSAKTFMIPSILDLLPFIFQLPPTKNFLSILHFFPRKVYNRTKWRPAKLPQSPGEQSFPVPNKAVSAVSQ